MPGVCITKAAITAAFLFSVIVALPSPTRAADIPPHIASDPWVAELIKLLNEWNAGTLNLAQRPKLTPVFEARVESITDKAVYDYQTDSWARRRVAAFKQLPETVTPELDIGEPGRAVLILLLAKGRSAQPGNEELRAQLELPLFVILGSAQERAKRANETTIGAEVITASLFEWWTTVWPFCD